MIKIKFLYFFILSTICFSQNRENQEINWAKNHFENHYSLMNFKSSKVEPIKLKEELYLIGKDTLYIKNDSVTKQLIINKFFNHFLSENLAQSRYFILTGLKVISENESKNIRRYQIYRNMKCNSKLDEVCLFNSVVYYFEITSNCKDCSEEEFYINGELTYLKKGGIIL